MRIGFIGCVEMSRRLLRATLDCVDGHVVGVVTRSVSPVNSDVASLAPIATAAGIPVLEMTANDQDRMASFLRARDCDVLYCFGWSYLLRDEILALPPRGVVGFHPAALPRNRGRHPLIWALVLGLEETASTFFMMDAEADHGPIVHQARIAIADDDDATSLYRRVGDVASRQVDEFTRALAHGTADPRPQDHTLANHWRRRSREDGRIDMRMSARAIDNLVRALRPPYPGAHVATPQGDVTVWRVEPTQAGEPNDEPGKVLARDGTSITVRCGDGAVRVVEHEFAVLPDVGSYL